VGNGATEARAADHMQEAQIEGRELNMAMWRAVAGGRGRG